MNQIDPDPNEPKVVIKNITWSKGLFRLWVVLSMAWVTLALAIEMPSIISPYFEGNVVLAGAQKHTIKNRYSSEAYDFKRIADEGRAKAYEIESVPSTIIYVLSTVSENDAYKRVAEIAPELESKYTQEISAKRLSSIHKLVTMTTIPLLLFWTIGYSLLWVARGFKT